MKYCRYCTSIKVYVILLRHHMCCVYCHIYIYIHICICYRSAAAHSKRRLANRKYDEFDGSSTLIWTYCHVDMLMFPEVALLGISMPAHGMI